MSQARKLQLPKRLHAFRMTSCDREAERLFRTSHRLLPARPGPLAPPGPPLGLLFGAEVQLRRLGRMPDGMSVNAREEEFGWGSGPLSDLSEYSD